MTTVAHMRGALAFWDELSQITVDTTDNIDVPFRDFPVGTSREDIWHYLEEHYDVSIAWLRGQTGNVNGQPDPDLDWYVKVSSQEFGNDFYGPYDTRSMAEDGMVRLKERARELDGDGLGGREYSISNEKG